MRARQGVAISFVDPAEEKHLAEIEKLLKKKVLVHQPEDYSLEKATLAPTERRERPGRSARGERTERAPRSARPSAPAADPVRESRERRREPRVTHADRMREREEAYARNPDQLLPAVAGTRPAGKAREVPMLLRKLPAGTVAADTPKPAVTAEPAPAPAEPATQPAEPVAS